MRCNCNADGSVYNQWQSRICYWHIQKLKAVDLHSAMGGFTRLLHRQGYVGALHIGKWCDYCRLDLARALCQQRLSATTWRLPHLPRVHGHSGKPDGLMNEMPTVIVQPLPEGTDQVRLVQLLPTPSELHARDIPLLTVSHCCWLSSAKMFPCVSSESRAGSLCC